MSTTSQVKPPIALITGSFDRPMSERIALYLGGQAVVARRFNISVRRIVVGPNTLEGRVEYPTYDNSTYGSYVHTELEWREREVPETIFNYLRFWPRRSVFLAHLIALLAGAAAERHFADGICHFNYQGDNKKVRDLILKYCPCNRHALKAQAVRRVRDDADTIFRLASHLTIPIELPGSAVDSIIGRSRAGAGP